MNSRLRTFLLTTIFILSSVTSGWRLGAMTIDEVPNVHIADRTRFVSNPSGILSEKAENELNRKIGQLWHDTSVEFVVVAIDEVDPSMTPEEFATRLFEKWSIGKSDNNNGLLMLISEKDHAAIIRTGYGVEGALPDILAGRIIRNDMFPLFRDEKYDEGVAAGVEKISTILRDPSMADELMSEYDNDSTNSGDDEGAELLFKLFLTFGGVAAVVLLIVVVCTVINTGRDDDVNRYRSLDRLSTISLFACFLTLGMALPAYLILRYTMHRVRRHKRSCPNCSTQMVLIDEEHDNDYLSRAQDVEEKINSIDYDVWHCPNCAHTDILP